jgi:hypothetical protein
MNHLKLFNGLFISFIKNKFSCIELLQGMRKKILASITIIILSVSGCSSSSAELFGDILISLTGKGVKVPESDSTPPKVKIIIPYLGPGGSNVEITNSPKTINLTSDLVNDGFHVIAVAEDPEGVKSINIPMHDITVFCKSSGNLAQNQYYLMSGLGNSSKAKVGEMATTKLWVDYFVYLAPYESSSCNPGFSFSSVSLSFNAEGQNFHSSPVATSSVTFYYKP